MLESLSKALQPISLLAIVTLSIFNLGYFWKIGLHFLGLMDFSNIVYSFGLTLTVLTAVLIVGNWVAPKLFKPITPDSQARIPRNGYIVWVIGFFFLWFGYLARDEWFERLQWGAILPGVMRVGALLVGWCLLVIALAALQWLLYKAGVWEVKPLLMLAFFAGWTTFQAGKLGAELEIHSSQTYSVVSKSGGPPKP